MEGSSQLPITASTPSYAKRKARALIGWLSEQEGVLWAAGRDAQAAATQPEHMDTCKRARQNVAARSPGVDQSNLFQPVPVELQSHIEALKADPESAQVLLTSGEIQIVDLRRVCAAQPHVLVEDAKRRVEGIAATDMLAIALVTLPLPKREQFPVTFDPIKNTWLFASPNPNLRVIGNFSTSVGPGFAGFGFAIGQQQSYMQVAGVNGRYFLRDGYHRAYGLVAAGITHAPALVKDFNTLEDANMPPGLLPQSAYLGERPPLLVDYLDDGVAVDTNIPSTTKMIVIQALEVSSIA
jgi:hypothetical protein